MGKRAGFQGARGIALAVLEGVERGEKADDVLDGLLEGSGLTGRDRGLATEISYGTLRRRNTLDWALNSLLKTPLDRLTPAIRNLLRIGAYQILYLDRVPDRAAVFESVELARQRGHEGTARLVNGVLRNLSRKAGEISYPDPSLDPIKSLSVRLSHPDWLVKRWLQRFGDVETGQLLQANLEKPPLTVRANSLKGRAGALGVRLGEEGVKAGPGLHVSQALVLQDHPAFRDLPSFREGLFSVQDESSMLASLVCQANPGEMVIDACSAPGGKATHLAELMGDRGEVIAVDTNPARLTLIRQNVQRLGLESVTIVKEDARNLGDAFRGRAHRLLVDAPCSGLGVLRRNPDGKWLKNEGDIRSLARIQLEILEGSCGCLRPGGVLLYSVCTFEPEENQEVVGAFLQRHPEFRLESVDGFLPGSLRGQGGDSGIFTLYPHRHGTDGFFVARMRYGEEGQA